MQKQLNELRERLAAVSDIRSAVAVLSWDQEVNMPPKGAEGRGHQIATLSAHAHRLFTDAAVGRLLDDLASGADGLTPAEAKLIEVTQYDYDRATRLPESFVTELALECSKAYEIWVRARKESSFALFRDSLARIVDLNRRKAEYFGFDESPYDALLDEYERGMTTAQLRPLFGEVAKAQSALVERIVNAPRQPDTTWTAGPWDEAAKWGFTVRVLRDLGFDMDAGRQDKSVHPFSTQFDLYDVRVTTRFSPDELFSGLMGTIHECGHALYSQGHDPADRRTPLLEGASLGIHESQSRLWENVIGRSLPFWRHYLPILQEAFPERLKNVQPEQVYQAVNRVEHSLIRVEADECTYNLHVILRFEIEVGLIEGTLSVDDVPDAWNAKVKEYLGLDVPDDAHGCLQDIHWSHGAFGYFPTYALGNLYAAQLFETIVAAIPDLWTQVDRGEFAPLLGWLRENIHRHGRRKLPLEILKDATGKDPDWRPYLKYLEEKYGALYDLDAECSES
ncbi:MAG: carboxypeptidase M32 [Candidatus Hydrogenedentota bacterium]